MKFKLDENFSASLVGVFKSYGHQASTVADENLCSSTDARLFEICQLENRCLVTMDKDFSNIINFPPGGSHGIALFRPPSRFNLPDIREMIKMFLASLGDRSLQGKLWIIEKDRIREYQE